MKNGKRSQVLHMHVFDEICVGADLIDEVLREMRGINEMS